MAIPTKRYQRNDISYLDLSEIKALLARPTAPAGSGAATTRCCSLAIQTGLRVSELTPCASATSASTTAAHVRVIGKGRKARATTLTRETVAVLRAMAHTNATASPRTRCSPPATDDHSAATPSHCCSPNTPPPPPAAAHHCTAKRVTPHALSHTNAMLLTSQRRRHRHDRALARPREHPHHPHLPTRRPSAQRASDRPHRPARHQTRPIPTPRHAPRLPRSAVIMPSQASPTNIHPAGKSAPPQARLRITTPSA